MNKYIIQMPLQYNSVSNLDRPDMSSELSLNLDKSIEYNLTLKMTKGDFESCEECKVKIDSSNGEFSILMDSLYADNEDYAIAMTKNIADRICYVLTYIVQNQNPNFHYFHPKFTYEIRDIKCREEIYTKYQNTIRKVDENGNETLFVGDRISFKDTLHDKIIYRVKTDMFETLFFLSSRNKHLAFAIESYYRALGDIEFISKYYNLFSIIEYVENNFKQYADSGRLFTDEQKEGIIDIVRNKAVEYFENEKNEKKAELLKRFRNRVSQLLTDATDKTRAEKLNSIIRDYFHIYRIEEAILKYDITAEKLKEFIDTRNSLFHAKKLNKEEENKLTKLTNELMILCKNIINKLIEK